MATETVNVDATAIKALITAEASARASADSTEATARAAGDAASVSTASSDASAKANAAQAAAIAAAAIDATTKANAAQAAAIAASQPVDSDLTAIAALTTTSFGRALLELANAAAGRTAFGLGTAATSNTGDFDAAGAAAAAQSAAATDATTKANAAQAAAIAASQPVDSDLMAIAALTTTSFGRSFLDRADAAAGRTLLGLGTLATQSGTFSGTSSGTNTGDQSSVTGNAGTATALQTGRTIDGQTFDGTANVTVIAPGTHAATTKATPVDADELPLVDSAASNVLKKLTWANLKATLKTYFDTLYPSISAAAHTMLVNNTAGTANLAATTYNSPGQQVLAATVTWTAGTAPSGTSNLTYNWTQIGNMVVVQFSLTYSVAGSTVTGINIAVPSDMPSPVQPTGFTSGGNYASIMHTLMGTTPSMGGPQINVAGGLRRNAGDTAFEFVSNIPSGSFRSALIHCTYFTA